MQLNLLVIRAKRPRALAGFYERLGLVFQPERHGEGPEHLACEMKGCVFEIYPVTSRRPSTEGLRIGFEVADLDAACNAALQADGILVEAPCDGAWGRRAVMRDPEGHLLDLVQR